MLFSVETDTGTYIVQEPCGQGLTKAEGFPWGDTFVPALTLIFFFLALKQTQVFTWFSLERYSCASFDLCRLLVADHEED